MKPLIITAIFLSSLTILSAKAGLAFQKAEITNTDTAKLVGLPQLLSSYYDLKNALISSDPNDAAAKGALLLKAAVNADLNTLTKTQKDAVTALKDKLEFDSRHISETRDLNHQREHFAALSLNMWKLAKAVKLSAQPVYELYCPMKKTYWLSSESSVKNPYYGKGMLTCGRVAASLK